MTVIDEAEKCGWAEFSIILKCTVPVLTNYE